jgi:hypothetical protein
MPLSFVRVEGKDTNEKGRDMELNAKDTARLARAVEGRNSAQGFVYGTKQEYKTLLDAGLVDFDEAKKDGNKIAMRASDAGLAAFTATQGGGTPTNAPAGVVTPTAEKPAFKITKEIPMPKVRRREGESGSKYPFDALEIGDSFHVPITADMPDPKKSMASSITAAKMRYSNKLEGQHKSRRGTMVDNVEFTRNFAVRAVGKDDPEGPGARVWRVPLAKGDEAEADDGDDNGGEE